MVNTSLRKRTIVVVTSLSILLLPSVIAWTQLSPPPSSSLSIATVTTTTTTTTRISALSSTPSTTNEDTLPPSKTTPSTTLPRKIHPSIFGDLRQMIEPSEEKKKETSSSPSASSIVSVSVPTYIGTGNHLNLSQWVPNPSSSSSSSSSRSSSNKRFRRELQPSIHQPSNFLVDHVLTPETCRTIRDDCESLGFATLDMGKNNHGVIQVLVPTALTDAIAAVLEPYVDVGEVEDLRREMIAGGLLENGMGIKGLEEEEDDDNIRLVPVGLNRRWRIYRYAPGGTERFSPHVDAGFPPSGVDGEDGSELIWDATTVEGGEWGDEEEVVSRLTVLFYLNDDFVGGETSFFPPASSQKKKKKNEDGDSGGIPEPIAAVRPKTGSCLIIPQYVGEDGMVYAQQHWPSHEGSPVRSGSPKYVIRSDVLFATRRG